MNASDAVKEESRASVLRVLVELFAGFTVTYVDQKKPCTSMKASKFVLTAF